MSRDERLYLQDIYECCQKVLEYSKSSSYRDFCTDQKTIDAVLHNLLVIGEATKSLPVNLFERYPEIPWKKIKGLRDIIAHQYFGLDYPLIWDIVKTRIPDLQMVIHTELSL